MAIAIYFLGGICRILLIDAECSIGLGGEWCGKKSTSALRWQVVECLQRCLAIFSSQWLIVFSAEQSPNCMFSMFTAKNSLNIYALRDKHADLNLKSHLTRDSVWISEVLPPPWYFIGHYTLHQHTSLFFFEKRLSFSIQNHFDPKNNPQWTTQNFGISSPMVFLNLDAWRYRRCTDFGLEIEAIELGACGTFWPSTWCGWSENSGMVPGKENNAPSTHWFLLD